MQVGDIFYRVTSTRVADLYSEFYNSGRIRLDVDEWKVSKVTPKGCWITSTWSYRPKFIRAEARKKYAYPSKEEAMQSFVIRKTRQIKILTQQLEDAQVARLMAEAELKKISPNT